MWLDGSMTMSGNSAVVTVGALVSGTSTGGAGTGTMSVELVDRRDDDVAGNTATGNTAGETGATDRDF